MSRAEARRTFEVCLEVHMRCIEGPSNAAQPEYREGVRRLVERLGYAIEEAVHGQGAVSVHVGLVGQPYEWPSQ